MNYAAFVIFRAFFDICLLQKRPEDLPASVAFLFICLLSYTTTSILLAIPTQTIFNAVIAGSIETVLIMLITYLLLLVKGKKERWLQLTTALSGTGTIFGLLALPLFYWIAYTANVKSDHTFENILVISLVIWNIAVMAHILRHALSASFFTGIFVSLVTRSLILYSIAMIAPQQAL